MCEYVFCSPAHEIEPHPIRKEAETTGRQVGAPLARQHGVKLGLQGMQMKHIRSRIGHLGICEVIGSPVGRLLLFRQVNPQDFANKVLETMLVRIGAGKARRDLRAIDRSRHRFESSAKYTEVEPREVKDL